MNKKVLLVLIIVAAAVIVWSFFMPWAKVKTSVTKIAEKLTDAAARPLKEAPVAKEVIEDVEKVTDLISKQVSNDFSSEYFTISIWKIPGKIGFPGKWPLKRSRSSLN